LIGNNRDKHKHRPRKSNAVTSLTILQTMGTIQG